MANSFFKVSLTVRISFLFIALFFSSSIAAYANRINPEPEFAPGSIFLWSDGQWKPLVEATYELRDINNRKSITELIQTAWEYISPVTTNNFFKNRKEYIVTDWHTTKYCENLKQNNVYFICHGMNNNHNEEWIRIIAENINKQDPQSTILCIDWGYFANGTWLGLHKTIDPTVSAFCIDDAVDYAHDALLKAFDGQVDLSNFYFIGHSHGAHIAGRLTHKFGQPAKRITALDASEEASHMANSLKYRTWKANFIDYYKSSVICGTEYLVGNDNFILCEGDGLFDNKVFNDTKRHGYACEWFAETVADSSAIGGYNWDVQRNNYPKIIDTKGWSGVINAQRKAIECYSNHEQNPNWNYPQPWYQPESNDKPSEWHFRNAISSTIDYEALTIEKTDKNNNDNILRVNNLESLHTTIYNNANPLTISKNLRQSSSKFYTNIAYISRQTNDSKPEYKTTKDIDSVTTIVTESTLFYLDHNNLFIPTRIENNGQYSSVDFYFTPNFELWQQLGGNPEEEYIDCDVWIIYGVDSNTISNKSLQTDNYPEECLPVFQKPAPTNSVRLWKGELDPSNNVSTKKFRLYNPGLACDAGPNQTITLRNGQSEAKIKVHGKVLQDNGKDLSYNWIYNQRVFSAKESGTIKLGPGTHKLIFRITDWQTSATDTTTVTVIKEEITEPQDNYFNHPQSILNRHLVLSLGYGTETFECLDHYKYSASNAFSLYFGNISYIIKPLKSPICAGLEYGINLRFSNYNKQLITTLVSEDVIDDFTSVYITHFGGIGLPFGPVVTFIPKPKISISLYTHICPYLALLSTKYSDDSDHYIWYGYALGGQFGARINFGRIGVGVEYGLLSTPKMRDEYFLNEHDFQTGKNRMNVTSRYWSANLVFTF